MKLNEIFVFRTIYYTKLQEIYFHILVINVSENQGVEKGSVKKPFPRALIAIQKGSVNGKRGTNFVRKKAKSGLLGAETSGPRFSFFENYLFFG